MCTDASPLAAIEKPFLIVHGTADTVIPIDMSATLVEQASSDDKTLLTYEGVCHAVEGEDPQTIKKIVSEIVDLQN